MIKLWFFLIDACWHEWVLDDDRKQIYEDANFMVCTKCRKRKVKVL